MDSIRTVKPVVLGDVEIEAVQLGEWVLYRGNFFMCIGACLLAGPVGSLNVRPQAGELVRRVYVY